MMFVRANSLRRKLIFGYLAGLALFLGVTILNIANLLSVERLIVSSDKVTELLDTALEIRRFEKNYFLYKSINDHRKLLDYVRNAEGLLGQHADDFRLFVDPSVVFGLRENLLKYNDAWKVYLKFEEWESSRIWEEKIRDIGREFVTTTEDVSKNKSRIKQATIRSARNTLIVSISMFFLVIFSAGFIYHRMLIKPIVSLERHMDKITAGEFALMPLESCDRELVSLNNACNRMLRELEARQKSFVFQSEKLALLGTMVSGVAHQLNNPLSNISTSCQILLEELNTTNPSDQKRLLEQVEGQVDRAKGIVGSLLEFSRKKDFKNTPLPLSLLIEDAVNLLSVDVPPRIEIKMDIPDTVWIFADKQRLQQALMNILKNSVDAIPEEGRILISAREEENGKTVEIKIRDTGIGIEPEHMDRLFEPFFTTKADGKGSGLGLFVAKEIIEEERGAIIVESSGVDGTTFAIKLPVKETGWNGAQKSS